MKVKRGGSAGRGETPILTPKQADVEKGGALSRGRALRPRIPPIARPAIDLEGVQDAGRRLGGGQDGGPPASAVSARIGGVPWGAIGRRSGARPRPSLTMRPRLAAAGLAVFLAIALAFAAHLVFVKAPIAQLSAGLPLAGLAVFAAISAALLAQLILVLAGQAQFLAPTRLSERRTW